MDDEKKPKNRLQEIIENYLRTLEKRTLSKGPIDLEGQSGPATPLVQQQACQYGRPFFSRDGKRVLFVVK
jgi:hypothetical protein